MNRKLLHSMTLPVRWGDMDAVGHVNNAVYFTYFEQVRIAWYESLGLGGRLGAGAEGPVVVKTSCEYRLPLVYPADVELRLYGLRLGNSSFDAAYEVRDAAEPATLYAEGEAVSVWVDHEAGRSKPLPAIIRDALAGHDAA